MADGEVYGTFFSSNTTALWNRENLNSDWMLMRTESADWTLGSADTKHFRHCRKFYWTALLWRLVLYLIASNFAFYFMWSWPSNLKCHICPEFLSKFVAYFHDHWNFSAFFFLTLFSHLGAPPALPFFLLVEILPVFNLFMLSMCGFIIQNSFLLLFGGRG